MSEPSFSPREEALIALLAQGHTDATAARIMGISERSISNIVRGLMDRIGVENRFQLGVALGTLRVVPIQSAPDGDQPAAPADEDSRPA